MSASNAETATAVLLENRAILGLSGGDVVSFLQGLISTNAERLDEGQALYGALLTPQGKFLHDFFLARLGDRVLLDVAAERAEDLAKRLAMYKLRADVGIETLDDFAVVALLGGHGREDKAAPLADGIAFADPRLGDLGARAILPRTGLEEALATEGFGSGTPEDYETLRLGLGVPDGARDLIVDKSLLLESNFEELHGVDFDKGCYIGQEVTSRTKYRGLVKKRLMRVEATTKDGGKLPPPGAEITLDGKNAGEMRSSIGGTGLALIRLEALETASKSGAPLIAGEVELNAAKPAWAVY